jgi:voltage-gated potassium channel
MVQRHFISDSYSKFFNRFHILDIRLKKDHLLLSKHNLHALVHDTDTNIGRIFDLCIQTLIIISLITFSLETLPNLSITQHAYLQFTEMVIVGLFTVEYVLRIYVAKQRFSYIFSFYGMIDLIAVLPFYLTLGLDLRTVRLFRLFRLFRVFKLLKYSKALSRFKRAFILVKEEMLLFGFVALIMLYLSAVGIYYFENAAQPELFQSVFHSLWWALTTLTTVGYGDMYPITVGGRIFTFLVLMVGLGIVAVPTGLIATALSQTRIEEEQKEVQKKE